MFRAALRSYGVGLVDVGLNWLFRRFIGFLFIMSVHD